MHHHRRFLPMQHIPSLSTQVAVVLLSQTISLHVPYQSVTSHCMSLTTPLPVKPATIRGKGPCSAFLGSMSGTSRRIRLLMSVSVLCAEKQNTLLYPVVFTGCGSSFSRNHYTACQLQFTKGIINRERFSAHLDSMFGTWVNIRATI